MARIQEITRKTKETDIFCRVNLDGTGAGTVQTGIGFFDHMLDLFKTHSGIDVELSAKGDTEVDFHHTVEDAGIVLGEAISAALGTRAGIERFSSRVIPMDDSAVLAALDFGGRASLLYDVPLSGSIGLFDTELAEEFFRAFSQHLKANLYLKLLAGGNKHHVVEAAFKAVARCMKDAVRVTGTAVPSTKGSL